MWASCSPVSVSGAAATSLSDLTDHPWPTAHRLAFAALVFEGGVRAPFGGVLAICLKLPQAPEHILS